MQLDNPHLMEGINGEIWDLIKISNTYESTDVSERVSAVRAKCLSVFQNLPKCMLTKLHKSYVALLLQYGYYEDVFSDLSLPISCIDSSVPDYDIVLFFYYLGLAQIRTLRFLDARMSMLSIIGIPASEFSVVSLAACRKLCLLDLIVHGRLIPLPEWIVNRNPPVNFIWEDLRKGGHRFAAMEESQRDEIFDPTSSSFDIYSEIVRVYASSDDPRDLIACIARHRDYLKSAKDLGLVNRVLISKRCQILKGLERSHSNIPLVEVLSFLRCDDVDPITHVLAGFNAGSSTIAKLDGEYVSFTCTSSLPPEGQDIPIIHSLISSLGSNTGERLKSIKSTKLQV